MPFKKASATQSTLKMSMYGPPGSGKTFTALLIAEGLARHANKRVAYVDTENGTVFYSRRVPDRPTHPEAFDFDALYTRSVTEILAEVRRLSHEEHGVVVLDSMSHIWDACMAAYNGPRTRAGTIPMHAWARIKKPYKDLMHWALNCPMHVLLLGRQGNVFEEDETTGETKAVGVKMRAEGETQYEPHVCLRMEAVRTEGLTKKAAMKSTGIITAFTEKDRSGILQGQLIEWPSFETVAAPLLGLLDETQSQISSEDEVAQRDAETLDREEREKARSSAIRREQFQARFKLAKNLAEVEAIGKEITPAIRRELLKEDVVLLRDAYLEARGRATGQIAEAARSPTPPPPPPADETGE